MFTVFKQFLYKHWQPLLVFFLILLVRGWYASTHLVFENDLVRDILVIEKALEDGPFLVGYGPKTSVGNFYTPGFYYHVHALASFFTRNHPLTMTIFSLLVESATGVVLFYIFSMYLQSSQAVVLSVFFGISALPVIFGSRAWNPTMIPFFSTLALYSWLQYIVQKKRWMIVLGVTTTACVVFLHFQGIVLALAAVLVGLYTLIYDRKAILHWTLGLLVVLGLLIPYGVAEQQQNWSNTRQIIAYYTGEHAAYYDRVSKPAYVFSFIPAFLERVIINSQTPALFVGRGLAALGFGVVFVVLLQKKVPAAKRRALTFVLIYILSILLMLRLYKGDKLDYYLSIAFIFPTLLLSFVSVRLPKIASALAVVGVVYSFVVLQSIPAFNQLQVTEEIMQKIVEINAPVRITFSSEPVRHSFSYHLYKQQDMIDSNEDAEINIWIGSKTDTPPQAGKQEYLGEYLLVIAENTITHD